MTGEEHYKQAENALDRAYHFIWGDGGNVEVGLAFAALAEAHATLANAAATAELAAATTRTVPA